MGELLFYIVTQEQSSARLKANGSAPNSKNAAASKWLISDLTFKTVLHCLRPSEDPIVRHFCTQTFENILAQSYRGDVYSNFTSHSVASELIKILSLNSVSGTASSSRNASNMVDLRATATSALAHLLCSSLRKSWQTGLSILLEVVSTKSVALFCEGKTKLHWCPLLICADGQCSCFYTFVWFCRFSCSCWRGTFKATKVIH